MRCEGHGEGKEQGEEESEEACEAGLGIECLNSGTSRVVWNRESCKAMEWTGWRHFGLFSWLLKINNLILIPTCVGGKVGLSCRLFVSYFRLYHVSFLSFIYYSSTADCRF
jgi:hypothetical protein